MKIHLITYATPRFRHRQVILGLSSRLNGVVDTVTAWTPQRLLKAGFAQHCKGISLSERGSGYWAWKPFIIDAKLREVPDGDIVFYCDVGRRFPYKILNRSLEPFLQWLERHGQDFLPGLTISWRGPMSVWTKRDAFTLTGMDYQQIHQLSPIQASFSIWRACRNSREFLDEWLKLCSNRALISDDPSSCGLPELPDYFEHRHDQALLTLCCHQAGVCALDMGENPVSYDTRNPSDVLEHVFLQPAYPPTFRVRLLSIIVIALLTCELLARKVLKFGSSAKQHPLAD